MTNEEDLQVLRIVWDISRLHGIDVTKRTIRNENVRDWFRRLLGVTDTNILWAALDRETNPGMQQLIQDELKKRGEINDGCNFD